MSSDADWLKGLMARGSPPPPAPAATSAPVPPAPAVDEGGPAQWRVGDRIAGLYQVTALLGEGGMGTVHKVRHLGWGIDLAVKSPKAEQLQRGRALNFVRECETWVTLGLHPHVVGCHYVRLMGGVPRVFAEYVDGGSLADWIRSRHLYQGGPAVALARILDVAIQFAWGLDFAHDQGLVHQDVKPANVMMTADGVAKISDFGLARARAVLAGQDSAANGPAGASVLVASGGRTPAYCSPEQFEGRPLSRRTDIWSYGLSVLEMFTGGVHWMAGQLAAEVLRRHLAAPAGEPGLPPMPPELARLLARCFASDPQARPARMADVAADLVRLRDSITGQPYPRPAPKPLEARADSLNNRALSLRDLGDEAAAERAWQQALAIDPLHLASVYNAGLLRWRRGEVSDEQLLERLAACAAAADGPVRGELAVELSERVHRERGEPPAAAHGELVADVAARQAIALLEPGDAAGSVCLKVADPDDPFRVSLIDQASRTARWTLEIPQQGPPRDALLVARRVLVARQRVRLSADGRFALAFPDRGPVVVIDGRSGRALRTLKGIDADVVNAGLSEDGGLAALVLGSTGATKIGLWEVPVARLLHTFERTAGGVPLHRMLAVAINVRSNLALSADADSMLRLWQLDSGRFVRALGGHRGEVRSVAISPDGRCAASRGADGTLRLWDLPHGRCRLTATAAGPVAPCRPLPARFYIVPVAATEVHQQRDAAARALLAQAEAADRDPSPRQALHLLRRLRAMPGFERDGAALAAWQRLARRCRRTALRGAWPLTTGAPAPLRLRAVALSADGRTAFGGDDRGRLVLIDLAAGHTRWLEQAHGRPVRSVCLSHDGKVGLSSAEHSVRSWDLVRAELRQTFEAKGPSLGLDRVSPIHLRDDGALALVADYGEVQALDPVRGTLLGKFKVPKGIVDAVHASADRRQVMATVGSEIHRWDLPSGQALPTLGPIAGLEPPREMLLASLSGRDLCRLVASADAGTLLLSRPASPPCRIHLAQGRLDIPLGGAAHGLAAIDGLASFGLVHAVLPAERPGADSRTRALQLWDLHGRRCLRAFEALLTETAGVALSLDGRTAALCLEDAPTQFWHLDWELEPHDDAWLLQVAAHLQPHLSLFLAQRQHWNEDDFEALQATLGRLGLAVLPPQDLRALLERLRAGQSAG